MEEEGRKFSDSDFLIEFNRINGTNVGENALKIWRSEMKNFGFFKERERLNEAYLQVFKNVVDCRASFNLTWRESARKIVLAERKKFENFFSLIDGTGDFDANLFEQFLPLAEGYGFDTTKFLDLQSQMTDELSKLPIAETAKEKIRVAFEDVMNLLISFFYVMKKADNLREDGFEK